MSEELEPGQIYGKSPSEIDEIKSDYRDRFSREAGDHDPEWYSGEVGEVAWERLSKKMVSPDLIPLQQKLMVASLIEHTYGLESSSDFTEGLSELLEPLELNKPQSGSGLYYEATWEREGVKIPLDHLSNADLLVLSKAIKVHAIDPETGMNDFATANTADSYFAIAERKMIADGQLDFPVDWPDTPAERLAPRP